MKAETREGAITPLFMACTNGNAAMIDVLLKSGADANSVKANGTTALMTASASGSADAVKVLLDHGADVNAKESVHGQTALMFAAALNRDAVVKVLLAHKADAEHHDQSESGDAGPVRPGRKHRGRPAGRGWQRRRSCRGAASGCDRRRRGRKRPWTRSSRRRRRCRGRDTRAGE